MLVKAAAAGHRRQLDRGRAEPTGRARSGPGADRQGARAVRRGARPGRGTARGDREGRQRAPRCCARAGHEISIAQKQQEVRFLQWQPPRKRRPRTLLAPAPAGTGAAKYYLRVLGLPADPAAPDTLTVRFDGRPLTEENFDEVFDALVGQFDQIPAPLPFPQLEADGAAGRAPPRSTHQRGRRVRAPQAGLATSSSRRRRPTPSPPAVVTSPTSQPTCTSGDSAAR